MGELFFDRIFGNLYFRKLYHLFGGGLVVCALVSFERNWFLLLAALYFVAFFFIGKRISFAILGILLLYTISGSKNLTASAAIIWLVGDGAAGLVGSTIGKRKLPWHTQKTLIGTIAFFIFSWIVILALLIFTTQAHHARLLILSTAACLVASFVESLPVTFIHDRKQDDNLLVLLLAGLTLWGLSRLLELESLLW